VVLIKEFWVVLPCSVQEYQVGQLYSVAESSKNETGGGEDSIEVWKNEPYEKDGEKAQYTHKIYHLKCKDPAFVRMVAPEGSLVTIVMNEYVKDDFFIKIETWHKPDLGTLDRECSQYCRSESNPALFQSVKTKRGPLGPNWKKELANIPDCPEMCAYKLVTSKFKWWGLQKKRMFTNSHRQLFCWIDKWIDLMMEDIRRWKMRLKELETMRKKGQVRRTGAAMTSEEATCLSQC
uniref:Phosphatidylinositol transfer protein beta isoform n=1 Tax=Nannospalax galili TaxID=1026970 RepID=A0A8C6RG23_NANGA